MAISSNLPVHGINHTGKNEDQYINTLLFKCITTEGFCLSFEKINKLSTDDVTELCEEVISYLQQRHGVIKTDKWKQRFQASRVDVDEEGTRSIINSVVSLYRGALKNRLTTEQFSEQLKSTMIFSESTKTALTNVWASQLVDVQWKVGVAVSSDECKSLNSPFVTLSLTVAGPSGQLQTHTLELTMAQFRNFTNQLKEISTVLETV